MSRAARVTKAITLTSALGAAVLAAPMAQAATDPTHMDVSLTTSVSGATVSVTYEDSGVQHLHTSGGTTFASPESGGYSIDFGDGSLPVGGNGMGDSQCTTKGAAPFKDSTAGMPLTHTYAKPGRHTITATGIYCGADGEREVTRSSVVTIGGTEGAESPTVVNAAAHIRYTVKGDTATLTPYLTGTQHRMTALNGPLDSTLPLDFSVTLPKGARQVSGNIAGDGGVATCTTKGAVALSTAALSGDPLVVRFPGPGTYPVTLTSDVCTPQGTVTKTVTITIPGAAHGTGAASPVAPAAGSTPHPTTTTPWTGPNVDTDKVSTPGGAATDPMTWGLVAAGGVGAAAGAAAVARRRRS